MFGFGSLLILNLFNSEPFAGLLWWSKTFFYCTHVVKNLRLVSQLTIARIILGYWPFRDFCFYGR